jgi:hypothetical protein
MVAALGMSCERERRKKKRQSERWNSLVSRQLEV